MSEESDFIEEDAWFFLWQQTSSVCWMVEEIRVKTKREWKFSWESGRVKWMGMWVISLEGERNGMESVRERFGENVD